MTINQPNDAPDRLVFSCSGIFRSMEILTDTDDYPYPTLAVRIHITLANDTVFTFRHVSGFKSSLVETWCLDTLDLEIWDVQSHQLENVRYQVVDAEQSNRLNFYCHSFESNLAEAT